MQLFNFKITVEIANQSTNFLTVNNSIYRDIEVEVNSKTRVFELKQFILSKLNFHTNIIQQIAFHENGFIILINNDKLIPLPYLQNQKHLNGLIVPLFLN